MFTILFIDSYKKKQFNNRKIETSILSTMMVIIYNLFYLPFASTMLSYIFCDNSYNFFFNDNFCWTTKHYIYFFLSIFFFFILFFICLDFISFGFSKNENMSCSVSKFVIKNGCLHFYIVRTIIVILFFMKYKYNIGDIYFAILFFTSLYNTYCFFIEHIYQNQKNLNGIFFFYLCLINCFASFLLFVGVLFKKSNIKGLDYIFILLFILLTLYIFFEKKQKMKISFDNLCFNNDLDVFNQLRLMLLAFDNVSKDRANLFDLFSYFFSKFEFLQKNELMDSKSDITEEQKSFLITKYFDETFKYFLNRFPQSIILKISYSIFLGDYLNRFDKSYIILSQLFTCSFNLNYSQEFFVYRLMRKIEEKSLDYGIDKIKVSLKYQCNKLIDLISNVSIIYIKFWNLILNSSENEDINKLNELGEEIHILSSDIEEKINLFINLKFEYANIYLLYGYYVRDILNDPELSNKYFLNINEMSDGFSNSNLFEINSLIPSSDNQFIIVSGKYDNFGTILRITLGICNILGYSFEELKNKNMKILLPDFLSDKHENFLKQKLKKNQIYYDVENSLKNHLFFMKSSSKYIVPVPIDVGPIYDEDYNLLLFGKINFETELRNQNFIINYCHILTNEFLIVQNFSSNSLQILDISTKSMSNSIDITLWIKEFNEIILKKVSNNNKKNINQVKIKILKKFYLQGKKNVITWKNGKKYLVTCEELKFENTTVAYLFHFCLKNLYETQEAEITKRQVLRSLSATVNEFDNLQKENSNEFPKINRNYIPQGNIIDINLNDSKYFFQNNNTYYEKKENIGDFFNRNYTIKTPINTRSYEVKASSSSDNSNNDSENFSNSNSENYSSYTQSEDSNSFSSQNSNKKNNKEIDNDESYSEDIINIDKIIAKCYKVDLSKIYFSIYNFSKNIIEDVNLLYKIGKVEDVIKGESKKSNFLQHSNEKMYKTKGVFTKEQKIQIGKRFIIPEITKMNKRNLDKNKDYINERIAPKFINNTILMGILWNLVIIFIILSFSSLVFSYCQQTRNNLLSLTKIKKYLSDLMENIYQAYSYSFQIVLLKHERYTNYDLSREEYITICRYKLLVIYQDLIDLSYLLNTDDIYISPSSKKKIDSYFIKSYYISSTLKYIELNSSIMNLIREYAYSVYQLANTNIENISFLNINYYFIFYNTDILAGDNITSYIDIYNEEYRTQKKDSNIFLWKQWFFFLFLICILFLIRIKLFINIIQEKEKYFKYFFRIENEPIKSAIKRCEKFVNINIELKENVKNIVSTPKINFAKDSNYLGSETDSLIDFDSKLNEENYFQFYYLKEKTNVKKTYSKVYIYDKKSLKTEIGIDIIVIFLFSFLMIRLLLYLNFEYNKIINYMEIYNLILSHKITLSKYINSLKIIIIYQYYSFTNLVVLNKLNTLKIGLSELFAKNGEIHAEISENLDKYGLPKQSYKIFKSLKNESLCFYFYNLSSFFDLNKSCENFANNIVNYGIDSVADFIIHSLYEFANEIVYLMAYSASKGYIYNELLYGNPLYEMLLPNESDVLKDYNYHNPFKILNYDKMKDFSILYQYIYDLGINNITNTIQNDIISLFSFFKKVIKFFEIAYLFIAIVFIFCYMIPDFYNRNSDINKSKRMLRIIPKDVLLELLTNVESEENIEKMNKKFDILKL